MRSFFKPDIDVDDSVLAVELSEYVIQYLELSYTIKDFNSEYLLLLDIKACIPVSFDLLNKEIFNLQKSHYQARVKKGHFYQLKYVISHLILTVFAVYISKNELYNYYDFKNYLSYPIDMATIYNHVPKNTAIMLNQGTLINYKELKHAVVLKSESKYSMMEYL